MPELDPTPIQEQTKPKRMPKVYSPDITPYSFEGRTYVFGTFLSFVVAPIRLVSRVMHNIFVLPANLQKDYAKGLLLVSSVLLGIGLLDLLLAHKWPLVVSQIPALMWAVRLKKQAEESENQSVELKSIEIDSELVQTKCSTIYDELEKIVKE